MEKENFIHLVVSIFYSVNADDNELGSAISWSDSRCHTLKAVARRPIWDETKMDPSPSAHEFLPRRHTGSGVPDRWFTRLED